jgi:protoporphyrinogen/coproporphyrinogen III oxidase
MRTCIAVIGGGITGLAAAYKLADRAPSVDLVLLEANNRLGGVLETTRRGGFLIEAAADNFLTTPPAAVDLCRELGLEQSLISTKSAHRRAFVIHYGRLEPIPEGFRIAAPARLRPLLKSRVLSLRGKLRAGSEYFIPAKLHESDESLASFVRRRFGREIFDRLVQPLVGGIYAADPERLSLEATMPQLREMERIHGGILRALLHQRKLQKNRGGESGEYGRFTALREGMTSMIDSLAARLPTGAVRLASPVEGVWPMENNRWLIAIGGKTSERLEVDGVVIATPAHPAAQLLAAADSQAATELMQIEYASCAVVSLGYRREQIGHPLDGLGFVVPLLEERTILACSFSSVKYEGRAPSGLVLLRVVMGGARQDGLLQLTNDELAELAEAELSDSLGIHGPAAMRHVTRHDRAMPQYHVGHRQFVSSLQRRLSRYSTLALAGSAYGGVGVPACIRSGQSAADRILAELRGAPRRSSISRAKTEAVA